MLTYQLIRNAVIQSGLWDSGQENYLFLLSPDVYRVSPTQLKELEEMGRALQECLAGLGRIAATAFTPTLGYGDTWGMITRALRSGIPALYNNLQSIKPSRTPTLCKVDLMEAVDGHYYVAEVDGHNKHGLGYSTLAVRIRDLLVKGSKTFPGVARTLAGEIKRRKAGNQTVLMLYGDHERFYLPEFRILAAEMAGLGVNLVIRSEMEMKENPRQQLLDLREPRLLIDLPVMYHNPKLNEALAEFYQQGGLDFLLPPKPFLGSKAVLALLRNDEGNPELEAILRSQIKSSALETLRRFIPETYLIRKSKEPQHWLNLCDGRRFVLKKCVASGMKGTVFTDDPEFDEEFALACRSYYHYVLQEEVRSLTQHFRYYTSFGAPEEADWYTRVTVHFHLGTVADLVVTARQDKKVHGAPDCLQLGTVISDAVVEKC